MARAKSEYKNIRIYISGRENLCAKRVPSGHRVLFVVSDSHGRGPAGAVDAIPVDVVDHRVLQQVLDALAALEGPPDARRADFVRDPLGDDLDVVLRRERQED